MLVSKARTLNGRRTPLRRPKITMNSFRHRAKRVMWFRPCKQTQWAPVRRLIAPKSSRRIVAKLWLFETYTRLQMLTGCKSKFVKSLLGLTDTYKCLHRLTDEHCLTCKRSLVQVQYRPPIRLSLHDAVRFLSRSHTSRRTHRIEKWAFS